MNDSQYVTVIAAVVRESARRTGMLHDEFMRKSIGFFFEATLDEIEGDEYSKRLNELAEASFMLGNSDGSNVNRTDLHVSLGWLCLCLDLLANGKKREATIAGANTLDAASRIFIRTGTHAESIQAFIEWAKRG